MANRRAKSGNNDRFYFLRLQNLYRWWYSHEIKRCLLLGRKAMTNLNSRLKSRALLYQQRSVSSKLWFFRWSCIDVNESWTVKKAERQRINAFELCCWRRLLRFPWTARRSNQSILKELSPEYSLEGLMLKLKLQYFSHLIWRTDIWKDPDAGKHWRREEKGTTEDEMVGWHHRLNGHEFEWTPGVVRDREARHAAVHGVAKSRTWLSDWTELKAFQLPCIWYSLQIGRRAKGPRLTCSLGGF